MTISMFHELTHRTPFVCHGNVRPCRLNANDHGADAGDARPLSGGPQGAERGFEGEAEMLSHAVDGRKRDERQSELK